MILKQLELIEALDRIADELRSDEGYRQGWEANIAMAFYDIYLEGRGVNYPIEIARLGAKQFIDRLINNKLQDQA